MSLTPEGVRKRKRTSSGGSTLTSQHVSENLLHYGEIILHCSVNIIQNIRSSGNSELLKYVCALLNSGGGILHMQNIDAQHVLVLPKHLDTWWSGMERRMAEMLSCDDICNYFDLIGNHDDKDLYLFVKTAEHLCALRYHCRLPTDTATHEVTYQSLLRLMVNHGEAGSLLELPPIPDRYVCSRSAEELKKETKQIQFKQLSTPQNKFNDPSSLPERICSLMIRYVSAFANHEGGHIYFGIGDTCASVIGVDLTTANQKNIERLVRNRMHSMIWRDSFVRPERGIHWDINFFPVENAPKRSRRVIVVVSVCKFPGGVFTNCPYSTYINTEGEVVEFTFDQWKEAILNPLRDVPELRHRFLKLSLLVPRAPLVFSLPNTVEMIKNKVLLVKPDDVQPRLYIESYADSRYREGIRNVFSYFKGSNSVCLGLECWGLKIPMIPCNDILCDVAVATELDGIHVMTLAINITPDVIHHSQSAAAVLKNKLVQNGGCTEKFSVVSHVIDITESDIPEILEREMSIKDIYPTHFCSSKRKFDRILNSLAICMGAYMARSQNNSSINQNGSYYFVLTHDQFELLWTQQFTKELWVHGPAGAGKTVAAIQMIQELRRRGSYLDNILYLAENEKLCEFVRSHNLCMATTRRELLTDSADNEVMTRKYANICNVVVDEVQNFKDRDGDWYSLAEKLSNQEAPNHSHRCSNYFWLFMDYAQKVHKFTAGLPSVIGKNNFMLSEVSRSTKEIFDFTSRLMMASEHVDNVCNPVFQHIQSVPKLAHNFSSGRGVDILSCEEADIKNVLNKVLTGLLNNGIHSNDIAILVGKRTELDRLQSTLSNIHLNKSSTAMLEEQEQIELEMSKRRSVEEHLKTLGSEPNISDSSTDTLSPSSTSKSQSSQLGYEDISDDSLDEFETSNPFTILGDDSSGDNLESSRDHVTVNQNEDSNVSMETSNQEKPKVKFYRNESEFEDPESESSVSDKVEKEHNNKEELDAEESGVAIDTVRRFSGLDKAAVIGINPYVNEEHADFKKFLLSLATRAKDNLVIITTSDNIKKKLDQLV